MAPGPHASHRTVGGNFPLVPAGLEQCGEEKLVAFISPFYPR